MRITARHMAAIRQQTVALAVATDAEATDALNGQP